MADENINNQEEFEEYETFMTETRAGKEVEMAIVDRFEVDGKNYIAAALIENDQINMDGLYVYRSKKIGDELQIMQIEDEKEYAKVTEAYSKM